MQKVKSICKLGQKAINVMKYFKLIKHTYLMWTTMNSRFQEHWFPTCLTQYSICSCFTLFSGRTTPAHQQSYPCARVILFNSLYILWTIHNAFTLFKFCYQWRYKLYNNQKFNIFTNAKSMGKKSRTVFPSLKS